MTAPLTPEDCDLRDFPRMMIDVSRLRQSEFDATPDDCAWRAGLNLWFSAWHSVPAGSLANDDAALAKAAGLGRDLKTWRDVKEIALRGFVLCDDGRLYHETVCEFALEAWIEKLIHRLSSGAGNAKRWGTVFEPTDTEAAIERAAGLLAALAPDSKALLKARRRHARPNRDPTGNASGNAGGTPDRNASGNAGGTEKDASEQGGVIPPGSQGKGTGKGIYSDPNGSGGEPPDDRFLVELSELPPDKRSWRLAKHVIVERGGKSTAQAGEIIGRWMKGGTITHEQLWNAAEAAWRSGTEEPVPYITAALKAEQERSADPMRHPEDWRQRRWMEEFVEGQFQWNPQRGPEPGQPGCRVTAAIQREFGVTPAAPLGVDAA